MEVNTEGIGVLQPFVWLYVKTDEDDYTEVRLFPLIGGTLRSFQDEVLFSTEAVPGSNEANTARSATKIQLFDPQWTYLENLLLNNKFLSFEYGWLDEEGNVLQSSGIVRCMLASIKPSFTTEGTDLDVILITDFSVANESGSSVSAYATTVSSRQFIPLDTATRGDLAPITSNNEVLQRSLGFTTKTKSFPGNVIGYERISDIVIYIATLLGLEYDVDETSLGKSTFTVRDKTLFQFIRSDLVNAAKDSKGVGNFRFWVRGNNLYFKQYNPEKVTRRFTYMGSNTPLSSKFTDPINNGILLSFALEVLPDLITSGPRIQTKTTSFDPINKKAVGSVWTDRSLADNILSELLRIDDNSIPEYLALSSSSPDRDDIVVDGIKTNGGVLQKDFFLWDTAVKAVSAALSKPNARSEYSKRYGSSENKLQLIVYNKLRLDRAKVGLSPAGLVSAIEKDNLRNAPNSNTAKDPTLSGRAYVLPYPDERTANIGNTISASAAKGPFKAKAMAIGDPSLFVHSTAIVVIQTPVGYHYGSGRYLVTGVSNRIDGSGFTTEISMVTDGVSGNPDVESLTKPNPDYKKTDDYPPTTADDNKTIMKFIEDSVGGNDILPPLF